MKRDLKINFYILEEIVAEIQKYSSASEEMERASSSVISMLELNESQGIAELEKLYQGFSQELKKSQGELQDLATILSGYTNEMQAIIRPINHQSFMRVDRNDIWFNMEQIINACDNINYALEDQNLGWDEFGFGKSEEKEAREERNYRKMEDIWEHVIPRFTRRLGAQLDAINDVYTRKVIPFENKDDEYQTKANRLYYKYTNLWESIRTDITDDINIAVDLVHGAIVAIIDLVKGIIGLAWGVISYRAAVEVLAVTYPLNAQPKWAEEIFNGTNTVVGSILRDPMLVVEAFGQQASDAFEEEGAAYSIGYVAVDLLGPKGLGKLAKVGKAAGADEVIAVGSKTGVLASEEAEEIAFSAIKGKNNADAVVLGKFGDGGPTAYTNVAESMDAQYFQLDNWDELASKYSDDEIWKINEKFLDIQTSSGREVYLSHNPYNYVGDGSFYSKEIQYLLDSGYRFVREGDVWHAVR